MFCGKTAWDGCFHFQCEVDMNFHIRRKAKCGWNKAEGASNGFSRWCCRGELGWQVRSSCILSLGCKSDSTAHQLHRRGAGPCSSRPSAPQAIGGRWDR